LMMDRVRSIDMTFLGLKPAKAAEKVGYFN
jgi:hypothetical protein